MIYHVTQFEVPFVGDCVNLALHGVAKHFNCDLRVYPMEQFRRHHIDFDSSNNCAVVVEAAYLRICEMSVDNLRQFYPNAKIVVLGSDTLHHITVNEFQFDHPSKVDLYVDLMEFCANEYSKYCKTDLWTWTSSERLNNYLEKFAKQHSHIQPEIDFISVLSLESVQAGYRKAMIDFIRKNGWTYTRSHSTGWSDTNRDAVYIDYLKSRFTLGTTSHHNGSRTGKGWRDSVGVMLGRLLLYDDHPDSRRHYPDAVFYDYNDLNTLLEVASEYKNDPEKYNKQLEIQQKYVRENTIDNQLIKLFEKHNILRKQKRS